MEHVVEQVDGTRGFPSSMRHFCLILPGEEAVGLGPQDLGFAGCRVMAARHDQPEENAKTTDANFSRSDWT